jgi:hypothetical protein
MKNFCKIAAALLCTASVPAMAEPVLPELRLQYEGLDLHLQVGVSGQGAIVDDDDRRTKNEDAQADLFARLNADYTTAGGVLLGANIEFNNRNRETESLENGEIYAFAATEYGRIEIGKQDGPADVLAFHAPVAALGQVRGDFARYAGSQALLSAVDTRDAFKIIYLTPPISGLRGGVSYSPKATVNGDAPDPRDRIVLRDAVEFGLQYVQPIGEWIVGFSGGYASGEADVITQRADLNSWSVGTEVRRGPLRIGAAYVDRGNSNRRERNFDQWEINGGIGWFEPRWGVSASAAYSEATTQSNRLLGIGGYYSITRNIQIRSDIVQFREGRLGRRDEDGVVALIELALII